MYNSRYGYHGGGGYGQGYGSSSGSYGNSFSRSRARENESQRARDSYKDKRYERKADGTIVSTDGSVEIRKGAYGSNITIKSPNITIHTQEKEISAFAEQQIENSERKNANLNRLFNAVERGDLRNLNLHQYGNNINNLKKPETNVTLLEAAMKKQQFEVAKLLIQRGAKVKINFTIDGMTPLHLAVKHDQYELAELILQKGGDVNAHPYIAPTPTDIYSSSRVLRVTPLNEAIKTGNVDIFNLLLQHGARITYEDMELVVRNKKYDIIQALIEIENVDLDILLSSAIQTADLDLINMLLSRVDINKLITFEVDSANLEFNVGGSSSMGRHFHRGYQESNRMVSKKMVPLYASVILKQFAVMEYLIEIGARYDINWEFHDYNVQNRFLQKLFQQHPEDLRIAAKLALLNYEAGKYELALENFNLVLDYIYLKPELITMYENALEIVAESSRGNTNLKQELCTHYNRMIQLSIRGNELAKAQIYNGKLVQYLPELHRKLNEVKILLDLGVDGLYSEILRNLDDILKITPYNSQVINIKAVVQHKNQDYSSALESFDKAISLMPKNIVFLANKASLLKDMGEYNKSAILFFEVAQLMLQNERSPEVDCDEELIGEQYSDESSDAFRNEIYSRIKNFVIAVEKLVANNSPQQLINNIQYKAINILNQIIEFWSNTKDVDVKKPADVEILMAKFDSLELTIAEVDAKMQEEFQSNKNSLATAIEEMRITLVGNSSERGGDFSCGDSDF